MLPVFTFQPGLGNLAGLVHFDGGADPGGGVRLGSRPRAGPGVGLGRKVSRGRIQWEGPLSRMATRGQPQGGLGVRVHVNSAEIRFRRTNLRSILGQLLQHTVIVPC